MRVDGAVSLGGFAVLGFALQVTLLGGYHEGVDESGSRGGSGRRESRPKTRAKRAVEKAPDVVEYNYVWLSCWCGEFLKDPKVRSEKQERILHV